MQLFRRYPYKTNPKRWIKLLMGSAILAFTFATLGVWLGTGGVLLIFLSAAGLAATCALYAAVMLKRTLRVKQEIILSREAITAPKSAFSRQLITIVFTDVTRQHLVKHKNHRREYVIYFPTGQLSIFEDMCDSTQDFEELIKRAQNSIDHRQIMGKIPTTIRATIN